MALLAPPTMQLHCILLMQLQNNILSCYKKNGLWLLLNPDLNYQALQMYKTLIFSLKLLGTLNPVSEYFHLLDLQSILKFSYWLV